MEIIELSGYTEDEKLGIAKQFLMEKQLEANGLTTDDLLIDDEAVRTIIHSYTREAGVRGLERQIAAICRGVAKEIVSGHEGISKVGPENLENFLGPVQFFSEISTRSWGPGLATGLAWTPVGGRLIFIETSMMPGKGSLVLTGQLGDVMKESASAALTYVRSHFDEIGIKGTDFLKTDIHIHIPAGATPKDGPSAGITMTTALLSLATGQKIRSNLAMTGELSLTGKVLAIGGLKEKTIAARRHKVKDVIIPEANLRDLEEIPEHVKKGISFHPMKDLDEVLALALPKVAGKLKQD
jgi:ATP-dependent Lon protease